jgi:hypothetical protein
MCTQPHQPATLLAKQVSMSFKHSQ